MHEALRTIARPGGALAAAALCVLTLAACGSGATGPHTISTNVEPDDTTLVGAPPAGKSAAPTNSVEGICEQVRRRLIAIGVAVFEHHRPAGQAVLGSAHESRTAVEDAIAQIQRDQPKAPAAAVALAHLERHRAQLEALEDELRPLGSVHGEQLLAWLELLRERANGCTERKPHS